MSKAESAELGLDESVRRLRRFLRNVGGAPIAAPLKIVLDELERLRRDGPNVL